ncbi:Lcl domain-containing protein, partial [Shewanella baltica]
QFSDSSNPAMFINSSEMTFNMSKCNSYAQSLSDNCIGVEVFDSTKYFFSNNVGENPPSKPHLVVMPVSSEALTAMGYTKDYSSNNSGKTYGTIAISPKQNLALFRADGQGEGGQAARWCNNLSQIAFMGRRDWTMPYIEVINGVTDDRYMRFLNQINRDQDNWQGLAAWLDIRSYKIANTILIGEALETIATSANHFVFCIAPLDVERVNLNVSVDNVISNLNNKGKVEATLYHSNNQPATGMDVSFKVNNGALFSNGADSIIVRTGSDGKASVELTNATEGVVTVTANYKDASNVEPAYKGITKTVDVTLRCKNLGGACIDILDTGSGKLFTNSPSKAYLDSIGGSKTDDTYESSIGQPYGLFYLFTSWDNANALCATYNTRIIGGRDNWRLPTKDELKMELHNRYGYMFDARGWPASGNYGYWSSTAAPFGHYSVWLADGSVNSEDSPGASGYASCVSELNVERLVF